MKFRPGVQRDLFERLPVRARADRRARPDVPLHAILWVCFWCAVLWVLAFAPMLALASSPTDLVEVCTDGAYVEGQSSYHCESFENVALQDLTEESLLKATVPGDFVYKRVSELSGEDTVYINPPGDYVLWSDIDFGAGGGDPPDEEDDFDPSDIDAVIASKAFGAGFSIVAIAWAIGFGVKQVLSMLKS